MQFESGPPPPGGDADHGGRGPRPGSIDLRPFAVATAAVPPRWRHAIGHLDRAGRVQLPDAARATMTDGVRATATVAPEGWKLELASGSQGRVGLDGRGRVRVPPGVRHRLGLDGAVLVSVAVDRHVVVISPATRLDGLLEEL